MTFSLVALANSSSLILTAFLANETLPKRLRSSLNIIQKVYIRDIIGIQVFITPGIQWENKSLFFPNFTYNDIFIVIIIIPFTRIVLS